MSFLLRNRRNALWDHRLACLCLIDSRETFTARTSQGNSSFRFEGFAPGKNTYPSSPSFPQQWGSTTHWDTTTGPELWVVYSAINPDRRFGFVSNLLVTGYLFFHILYVAPSNPFWDTEGGDGRAKDSDSGVAGALGPCSLPNTFSFHCHPSFMGIWNILSSLLMLMKSLIKPQVLITKGGM